MRIVERCGCGASIEAVGHEVDVPYAVREWRRDHRHETAPQTGLKSPESDEGGVSGPVIPERDPASTTAMEAERADPFGFGVREDEVIARG